MVLSLLLLLSGCARLPPPPSRPAASAPMVERAALPSASLTVYEVGTGHLSPRLVYGTGGEPVPVVIYAYVLDHPTAGRVVIDPGYGRRAAADPGEVPGRFAARSTGLVMGAPLAEQIDPASVSRLYVTHMHVDHGSGIEDFPGATVHIVPEEWDFGGRHRRIQATIPLVGMEHIDTAPLTFADGPYGPFEAHADVFGDGVLIALPTPGHTPGHTSFLVNLPGGSFLLTGDAAWVDAHWEQPMMKGPLAAGVIEVDGEANGGRPVAPPGAGRGAGGGGRGALRPRSGQPGAHRAALSLRMSLLDRDPSLLLLTSGGGPVLIGSPAGGPSWSADRLVLLPSFRVTPG